jgi:Uma2 family endonuclease
MQMKRTTSKAAPFTFEDFCALVREDQKADLINGVIYMASPENTDANELFVWLIVLFHSFVDYYDLGKVYGSRVAFHLDENSSPEPDIAFVAKMNLRRAKRRWVEGAPDVAVEIVSPDSIERDYDKKRKKYEEAGVPEYWSIDEIEETVTLLRLGSDGKYREIKPQNGEYHSSVLSGFWLRPEWLFHVPRPRKLDALQMILDRLK